MYITNITKKSIFYSWLTIHPLCDATPSHPGCHCGCTERVALRALPYKEWRFSYIHEKGWRAHSDIHFWEPPSVSNTSSFQYVLLNQCFYFCPPEALFSVLFCDVITDSSSTFCDKSFAFISRFFLQNPCWPPMLLLFLKSTKEL